MMWRFYPLIFLSATMVCAACAAAQTSPCFTHAPFINPRVINELSSWASDAEGDYVVAVNLTTSQRANRYFIESDPPPADQRNGTFWQTVDASTSPPSVCANSGQEHFCYRYAGQNSQGLIALHTMSYSDDGTSVFNEVMLLELRSDRSIDGGARTLLFKRGGFNLGDRARVKAINLGSDRLTVSFDDAKPKIFVWAMPPRRQVSQNGLQP